MSYFYNNLALYETKLARFIIHYQFADNFNYSNQIIFRSNYKCFFNYNKIISFRL